MSTPPHHTGLILKQEVIKIKVDEWCHQQTCLFPGHINQIPSSDFSGGCLPPHTSTHLHPACPSLRDHWAHPPPHPAFCLVCSHYKELKESNSSLGAVLPGTRCKRRQIQMDPYLMHVLHTVPLATSFLERAVVTGFMRMHEFLPINLTLSPAPHH